MTDIILCLNSTEIICSSKASANGLQGAAVPLPGSLEKPCWSAAVMTHLYAVGISGLQSCWSAQRFWRKQWQLLIDINSWHCWYINHKSQEMYVSVFQAYQLSWKYFEFGVLELLFCQWRHREPAPQQQQSVRVYLLCQRCPRSTYLLSLIKPWTFISEKHLSCLISSFFSCFVSCEPWAVSTASAQLFLFFLLHPVNAERWR